MQRLVRQAEQWARISDEQMTNHRGGDQVTMFSSRRVASHVPQITPAIEAAARNAQLGIYDIAGKKTWMLSGGTWLQGSRYCDGYV